MIDVFTRDAYAGFGIQSALACAGIAARTVDSLEQSSGALIVAASDLDASECRTLSAAEGRTLVVIGGDRFAREVFGARSLRLETGVCALATDKDLLSPTAYVNTRRYAGNQTLLPYAPYAVVEGARAEHSFGSFTPNAESAEQSPVLLARGNCLWMLLDLGAALSALLTESYLPELHRLPADAKSPSVLSRSVFALYYSAPELLRKPLRERTYAGLQRRLQRYGERASSYPIDPTGFVVTESIARAAERLRGGPSLRIAKWPSGFSSAAAISHDIEPCRYAYGPGLEKLLDTVDELGHPATFNLVAERAADDLAPELRRRLLTHELGCHGRTHRGDPVRGDAAHIDAHLRDARSVLAGALGVEPRGYRSPRLDRSTQLAAALDRTGWSFDSSFPDIDRENTRGFGGGVRMNLPYRPPVPGEGATVRASRCLELPLTAPDCIQPLFGGASVSELRDTVDRKAEYIRSVGGLYAALVHGGVFGEDDASTRSDHLRAVHELLARRGVWLTSMESVAQWWCDREAVYATMDGEQIVVTNTSDRRVERLAVEIDGRVVAVPALEPAESLRFAPQHEPRYNLEPTAVE